MQTIFEDTFHQDMYQENITDCKHHHRQQEDCIFEQVGLSSQNVLNEMRNTNIEQIKMDY